MNHIDFFESMNEQNVKTFNSVFENKIIGYDDNIDVEIGEYFQGKRTVKVGNDVIFLDLQIKNKWEEDKKQKVKKSLKFKKSEKIPLNLSDLFKKLTPMEFFIYHAIKEAGKVSGVEELSKEIRVSTKTIFKTIPRLEKLGLIKKRLVSCKRGYFNELTVDVETNLH
jgi:DNA-binding MarR family transcriptional regulator